MGSIQRLIKYRAHLGKWPLMAWCQKIYGKNCPGTQIMSVKNLQNSSAYFSVRGKFLIRPQRRRRRRNNAKHYKHPDIIWMPNNRFANSGWTDGWRSPRHDKSDFRSDELKSYRKVKCDFNQSLVMETLYYNVWCRVCNPATRAPKLIQHWFNVPCMLGHDHANRTVGRTGMTTMGSQRPKKHLPCNILPLNKD